MPKAIKETFINLPVLSIKEQKKYAGKHVALVGSEIVAVGKSSNLDSLM
jgi:hypothetical protein